ncbi:hypothetical protein TRICHSKD4_1906 [Roseibium sp. TrichSKD4]|nr:hypothetical protein TRICHSKD4_1906 [Roseibium sp. TrichSKD4]
MPVQVWPGISGGGIFILSNLALRTSILSGTGCRTLKREMP